jgi:hypothetical protein
MLMSMASHMYLLTGDCMLLQEMAEREVVRAAASGNVWCCASHPEHVRPMLQVGAFDMCQGHLQPAGADHLS